MADYLVVIPGVFGSTLYDGAPGGDLLWIDPPDLLIDDAIERLRLDHPTASVVAGLPVLVIYDLLIADLARMGTVVEFGYDWRRTIADNARALLSRIDGIVTADPAARVRIVAHSLGAVVARHASQLRDLSGVVVQLIALAPPYWGSHAATEALTGEHPWFDAFAGRRDEMQRMVATAPGLYDLLPTAPTHADADALYDRTWWPARLQISPLELARTRGFHVELAQRPASLDPVTDVLFAADRQTTAAVSWASDALMTDESGAGDGTVLESATFLSTARGRWQGSGDHTLLPLLPAMRRAVTRLIETEGCDAAGLALTHGGSCTVVPLTPRITRQPPSLLSAFVSWLTGDGDRARAELVSRLARF